MPILFAIGVAVAAASGLVLAAVHHRGVATVARGGLVHDRQNAAGCRDEIQALLNWWDANGPFAIRIPADGGLRQGAAAEANQLRRFNNGETKAKTLAQTPHGPRVISGRTRSSAVDIYPLEFDPGVAWEKQPQEMKDQFAAIGEIYEANGLTWGGRWTSQFSNGDQPHGEVPGWDRLPVPTSVS